MSAIIPTVLSAEMTYQPPYSINPARQLDPSQQHGKVRIASFTYKLLGTETTSTIIRGCNIPKNARVLSVHVTTDATTGTSTFDIGLIGRDGLGFIDNGKNLPSIQSAATLANADTVDSTVADSGNFFGTVPAVAGAQSVIVGNTAATNCGYVLVQDCQLIISVKTANNTGTANIFGYVSYIVD